MADNVPVTAGTGTNIATDDVGGVHYQRVKLVDGTLDSTAVIAGDATNGLDVDVTRARDVEIEGDVAHDAADAGNPVKIGAKALAYGAAPTAVAANDRTQLYANRHGVQFVQGGHPAIVSTRVNYTGVQTDAIIGPTNTSGTKIAVTQIQVTADNACTASPAVRIGFGSANTPTGDGVVLAHPGVPGGGGVSRGDGTGVLGVSADGEELRCTSAAPTGGSLDITVSYFLIES